MKAIFPALALAIVAHSIQAQQKELSLDPVSITGTISPATVSKSGRNIMVIEGTQLGKLPVNSIDELLRYLPGIEVQSRGPMGAQGDISMRGATFQQVLVILDGVRLNDPLTGHFNSYIPIAPAEIERIEILKGASSAIYGTEAVGGVINIISKSFAAGPEGKNKQASAEFGMGEFGLMKTRAGLGWQKNKTILSGGLLQNKADGQNLRGSKGFLDLKTLSFSAKQFLSENTSVAYRFAWDDRNFNAQNFYTQSLADTATEQVVTHWHQFNISHNAGRHRLNLDAGWKQASDKFRFNKPGQPNTNYSKVLQAQATHQFSINNKATLSSGFQVLDRSVESNNRGNHHILYGGIFTVLNQRIGENLHVNPALRLDYNERSGLELMPQLNVSYNQGDFQFRGSAGRSTRDADFTERYNNFQPAFVKKGNRIGNPDLLSESSWNYEAGADWFASSGLRLSITGFNRQHKNLIDYASTLYKDMPRQINLDSTGNGTLAYSLAKNLSSVTTSGVELDLFYSKNFAENHGLETSLGLVAMKSLSSGNTPSLYVSNHAKFLANFSLSYRFKMLRISANGLYKVRSTQVGTGLVTVSPDYFMMNARAEAILFKENLSLYFQADNVLDKRYSDILGPVMPGRWLSAGIKVSIR